VDPLQDFQDTIITEKVATRVSREAPPKIEKDERGYLVVDTRSRLHSVKIRCKTEDAAEEVLKILKNPKLEDDQKSKEIGKVLTKEAFSQ
jgi:glycosyltransferase involved in cell wall biosynthesis